MPGFPGSGFTFTGKSAETGPSPQLLVVCTEMMPETADIEKSTTMELVLAPDTTVTPAGSIQLYPLAY